MSPDPAGNYVYVGGMSMTYPIANILYPFMAGGNTCMFKHDFVNWATCLSTLGGEMFAGAGFFMITSAFRKDSC